MNDIEDVLRHQLHDEANSAAAIDGLLETTTRLGRRKQLGRRMAVAGSSVAAAAIVVGGSLVLANSGGSPTHTLKIKAADNPPSNSPADGGTPWWQTWPEGRHFGPVDDTFLTNARPTYDTSKGPEKITVWATGSEPDGTDWAMFTDPADGHELERLQGWNGQPDYGESEAVAPDATWFSWMSPTLDSHNHADSTSQFMIIVGKPGTTSIRYAADGTTFVDEPVQDGISVFKLAAFPPAGAKVDLATADGVYASGTPEGAGAGADATSSPTPGSGQGTATPSATPTSGS